MRKISAQRVIGTLVLLLFAALVLLPLFWLGRIRLQVGCGRHQVAANLFPDRVGHNTVCLCVESAPDCQNAA